MLIQREVGWARGKFKIKLNQQMTKLVMWLWQRFRFLPAVIQGLSCSNGPWAHLVNKLKDGNSCLLLTWCRILRIFWRAVSGHPENKIKNNWGREEYMHISIYWKKKNVTSLGWLIIKLIFGKQPYSSSTRNLIKVKTATWCQKCNNWTWSSKLFKLMKICSGV